MTNPLTDEQQARVSEIRRCVEAGGDVSFENAHFLFYAFDTLKQTCKEQAAEIERLRDVQHRIEDWCKAYPLPVFPELNTEDWKSIRTALKAIGYTVDRVSASNMRHVLKGIAAILEGAPR